MRDWTNAGSGHPAPRRIYRGHMAIKQTEAQEILTQLALLNEHFSTLRGVVEKSAEDHERRIRTLEESHGLITAQIGVIKERMTILNLLQVTLTGIGASLAYWLKK